MAGQQKIRGVEDFQEMMAAANVRDPRPTATKIIDWLKVPNNLASVVFFIGAIAYFVPAIADICLAVAGLLFWFGMTRTETLPLKFPMQSDVIDEHEPDPAKPGKFSKAKGIFFLGNEVRSGKEVWLTNSDCRQHFLLLGTTGTGKALPLDAKVHTPAGWREMGSLRTGDRVSTPDGRSASILGYYPQGELDIFKVTFEDGREAEACGEHLWEVHHKHWNGKYKPGVSRAGAAAPRVLRTREIQELLSSNKGAFSVRLPEEVQKPVADLSLDPYLVGALLGDGGVSGVTLRFSSADAHIVEKVSKKLAVIGHDLHQDDYAADCDYRIRTADRSFGVLSPLRANLRALGLEGTRSDTKFIPSAYKEGSVGQRWALIQGMMDTDGTIDRRTGSLSFSTSSLQMARDFQDVVRSLGGLAKLTEKATFYRNAQGDRVAGKTSYRISIRHPRPGSFFSLPRKLALVHEDYQYSDSLKLRIRSIEPVRRAQAACILIDHPDHLFITDNYVVTHNTESLLGFASNAVSWGSGCLFIDGKGDVNTFASFYALARRFGREDDVLVMNYMTGNTDVGAGGGVLLSNTMNPFSHGASDTLTNMIVSLMDDVGGDGAMWKGRATSMLTGLMRALIWLRDNNRIDLNVGEIRDHMNLKRIIDLADITKPQYADLPNHIRANIKSYLLSLPGFQEEKGYKQAQTTLDQHGYLEMQFTRILGSLADVYGHIFKTPFGEIDMNDVVLNRRLLLIMLPALEKSSDEIANLGKIVVATLRGMMGSTLGSAIEGAWQDIVENRLTKSPSPFIVILDEVGYYMVDGMDLMAAQARSLGFSLVFAGQDLNAMKRISEKVFGSVLGNTRTKVLLGTEDTETMELASKLGGKSLRTHMSGYSGETGEFGKTYSDNMEARIEEVERIHGLDIKAQGPGEAHIMFADKLVRVNMFYPAPNTTLNPRKLTLRTNHFITVGHPNVEAILSQQRLPEIVEKLCDPDFAKMMRHDADNAVKNLQLSGELEPFHTALADGRTKGGIINSPLDLYCGGFAQIVNDTDNMTADYQQQVPGGLSAAALSNMPGHDFTLDQSGDARRPRNIENPQTGSVPPNRQASAANARRPAEASSFDGDVVPTNMAPPPPRKSENKPFKSSKVDGKVRHGVNVDGNVHDMVDKLPAVPGVLDALAALDADGTISTKKEISDALNDAIKFADDVDDLGFTAPATGNLIKQAEDYTQRAMPEFEFADDSEIEGDVDGDGDGKDVSTMDFLTSLVETEGA